jgi:folate-binding protein YgfZ
MTPIPGFPTLARIDRSDRRRLRFDGDKCGATLTGLVTNDVLALRDGGGQYACALTPKGKIIADVRILGVGAATGDTGAAAAPNAGTLPPGTPPSTLLVDTSAAAGSGLFDMIRKYVNPRLAKYADVTDATRCITLAGLDAPAAIARLVGDDAASLAHAAPWSHRACTLGEATVRVVVTPELHDVPVYDLLVDAAHAAALDAALATTGAVTIDAGTWDAARIAAGRPAWGVDMDDTTMPQEAEMDALGAISYEKGCYTGQETVARIHFRGHVNRHLRRVHVTGVDALPPRGTELLAADDKPVGDLRSVTRLADGTVVGIAMLRREIDPGTSVRTAAGASLVVLPLVPS